MRCIGDGTAVPESAEKITDQDALQCGGLLTSLSHSMLVEEDIQTEESLSDAAKCTLPKISVLETSDTSTSCPLPALNANQKRTRNERILSMRKIRSRNAARSRRGKENYEFYELAKLLPIPMNTSSQLDKASIIRLTMSFLKMREFSFCSTSYWNMTNTVPPPNRTVKDTSKSMKSTLQEAEVSKLFENQLGSRILQSLDGFMFVLNCHGRFLYISETVSLYLGLSQVEMIGSSIFDYTYPEDRNELAHNLGLTLTSQADKLKNQKGKSTADGVKQGARSFFIRMKSTLTKRGISPKSSCYKVVYLSARAQRNTVKSYHATKGKRDETNLLKSSKEALLGVIAFGCSLSLQNRWDLPIDRNVFVVRVNPAFQFTYCDTNISVLFGFDVHEIVGQNFYHSLHAKDAEKLKKCHVELLSKGNVRTPYYRWLHKSGGYRWVYSSISLMANQRLYPDQTFIWVNHVISDVCEPDMVLDLFQLPPEERERLQKVAKRRHSDRNNNAVKQKFLCVEKDLEVVNSRQNSAENSLEEVETVSNVVTDEVTEKNNDGHVAINSKMSISSCDNSDENNNTVNNDGADNVIGSTEPKRSGEQFLNEQSEETGCNEAEVVEKCDSDNSECFMRPKSISLKQKQTRLKENILFSKPDETSSSAFENLLEERKVNILCVTSKIPEVNSSYSKKRNDSCTVLEYMDADSTVWENPPNKEISNHNDLPPGIKQMHGLWSIRHTPSAVHHHYPFGINPTLLHSNPLLAKIMVTGWGGCHQLPRANSFVLTTPVRLMSDCDEMSNRSFSNVSQDLNTQASVAAVLEELKKDPLHKVNPPNKVICPKLQGKAEKALSDSNCNNKALRTTTPTKPIKPESSSKMVTALNLYAGDVARAQVIQMPNTILLPSNGVFLNGPDTSIIAIDSDATVRLPLPSAHFQQHVSSRALQPFHLPQVAKVRTVPF